MGAKSLQESYQVKVNQLRKEIERLTKEAEAVKVKVDAARAAQQTIVTKQRELSYLAGEKDSLKEEWADALFEDDKVAIKEVESKKAELDNRTNELQGEIELLKKTIKDNEIDLHSSTELAVALDMLKVPDVWTYTNELQKLLRAEANELAETKKQARGVLPTSVELYDDLRSVVDANHKSSTRRNQERQARADKEKMLWQNATRNGEISL